MRRMFINRDIILLLILGVILIGVPVGIVAYDQYLEPSQIPSDAKVFTLTGHAERGWLVGEVHAYEMITRKVDKHMVEHPVIEVNKGDRVVFRLRSSDVTHGFSLKAFGIYLANGIKPGKTVFVSFEADKAGTFLFTCNAFCGSIHHDMTGTLLVRA